MTTKVTTCYLKKIEDPEIIQKLDKELLFIPSDETPQSYDIEQVNGLPTSESAVGQLRPIEVAIWFEDPNKDNDSPDRIHLRPFNGRHRAKANPNWRREYYDLSGYSDPILEYFKARHHFDLQKNRTKHERRIYIKEVADYFFNNLHIPEHEVCKKITEFLVSQGGISVITVSRYCPDNYKDPTQKARAEHVRSIPNKSEEDSSAETLKETLRNKENEIEKLHVENNKLQEENHNYQNKIESMDKSLIKMQSTLNKIFSWPAEKTLENVRVRAFVDPNELRIVIEKI